MPLSAIKNIMEYGNIRLNYSLAETFYSPPKVAFHARHIVRERLLFMLVQLHFHLMLPFLSSFRPWYTAASSPYPKDVILLIDRSAGMGNCYLGRSNCLDVIIEAANIIIETLNPYDRVSSCVRKLIFPR